MRAQSHNQFRDTIRAEARRFGWLEYYVYDSRHTPPGFPDCWFVKTLNDDETVLIVAEIKSLKDKLSLSQKRWLVILSKIKGVITFLWRPSDLEEIMTVLTAQGLPDIIEVGKKNVLYIDK